MFLPQSWMLTVSVTVEPVAAEIGEFGETSEYQKFGTPLAVAQWAFPEELPLLLNVMLGLLLLTLVTVKLLVVSCTTKVTVPLTCEATVKLATPFCVVTVAGRLLPLICVFESPELKEMFKLSETDAVFSLQSRM